MASCFTALGSEQQLPVLKILFNAGPKGLNIEGFGARSGVYWFKSNALCQNSNPVQLSHTADIGPINYFCGNYL